MTTKLLFGSVTAAYRNYHWIAPALLLYLLVSAINPYVFSSNGMLLIGFSAVVVTLASGQARRSVDKSFV
jgi:hypothetical protein